MIEPLDNILHLDNTQRSTWVSCKRKWYWKNKRHLNPMVGSTALRYGKSWHAGQDAFYAHVQKNGWTRDGSALEAAVAAIKEEWDKCSSIEPFYDDYRTLENCVKAFLVYISHFSLDEGILKVVDTERAFKVLMKNKFGEPYWFMGRIDTEVELDGRNWILEHKTTGQPIDVQANRLNRAAQGMGYTYALKRIYGSKSHLELDDAPEGILIVLHHLSSTKSRTTGNYGAPRIDFRRCPQMYSNFDLIEWKVTMDTTAAEIQRHLELNYFPQNHDSCFDYGSCPFLSLCDQQCHPDDAHIHGFRVEENPWTPMQDAAQIVVIEDFDGEVN